MVNWLESEKNDCMAENSDKPKQKERFLPVSVVAKRLDCSISNVYNLIHSKRLSAARFGAKGKGYKVAEAEFQRFYREEIENIYDL